MPRRAMIINARIQPFRSAYLLYQAWSTLFFRIPFWLLIAIPPSLRPRPTWTIWRCVQVRLLTQFINVNNAVGGLSKSPNHLAIAHGEHIIAEWIKPNPSIILGKLSALAQNFNVVPSQIPGYWLHQPQFPLVQSSHKVLLSLHGGGYTSASASPDEPTSAIPKGILEHAPILQHIFLPEYRLSPPNTNPLPAALMDALAAYAHLIQRHAISPADIVIEGDSSGGNLALALVRYLVEHRSELAPHGLAPPGALLLISPWCDMGTSHDVPAVGYFSQTDYFQVSDTPDRERYTERVSASPYALTEVDTNEYMSPASILLPVRPSFDSFPRTFIVCGGAEAFAPQIRRLRDLMGFNLRNGWLVYYEAPDGVHNYPAMAWHEPERTETFKDISSWLLSLWT